MIDKLRRLKVLLDKVPEGEWFSTGHGDVQVRNLAFQGYSDGRNWCEVLRRVSVAPESVDVLSFVLACGNELRGLLPSLIAMVEAGEAFWPQVYPEGMTAEDVRSELADLHFLMEEVPKVYDHITGGHLSKVNYPASTVIAEHDDTCHKDCVDKEIADAEKAELREKVSLLEEEVARLRAVKKHFLSNRRTPLDGE